MYTEEALLGFGFRQPTLSGFLRCNTRWAHSAAKVSDVQVPQTKGLHMSFSRVRDPETAGRFTSCSSLLVTCQVYVESVENSKYGTVLEPGQAFRGPVQLHVRVVDLIEKQKPNSHVMQGLFESQTQHCLTSPRMFDRAVSTLQAYPVRYSFRDRNPWGNTGA